MTTTSRIWLALAVLLAAACVWIGLACDPTPAPIIHIPTEAHP